MFFKVACLYILGLLAPSGNPLIEDNSILVLPLVKDNSVGKNSPVVENNSYKNMLSYEMFTLENARGKNGQSAYKNQDCYAVGGYRKSCICVFDGHGAQTGGLIADFVCHHLVSKILYVDSVKTGALSACKWMQDKIKKEKYSEAQKGGTTAVMGFVEGNKLTVVNVGDSRAVGVLNGKVTQLSNDHKPSYGPEKRRISKAGGVCRNGYVWNKHGGGLAVTRTFGDLPSHENDVVIATPEITEFKIRKGDKLIFASDGLWDVMSNEAVVNYLKNHAVDQLVYKARKLGSRDDITVVVGVVV